MPASRVEVVEREGIPTAQIPCLRLWDLVEYLSFQRVNAKYEFKQDHFVVTFTHQSVKSSQRLLDEWDDVSSRSSMATSHTEEHFYASPVGATF